MSCCTITIGNRRIIPKYDGVDPQIAPYVAQWTSLAKDHGLKFDRAVSIGFMNINNGLVIGQCNFGFGFREIDIDSNYWANSTQINKMAMVFHELGHCKCDRGHDYIIGESIKEYGNDEKSRGDPQKEDGFFPDRCPVSLMFPTVSEDRCTLAHYQEYVDELFRDCDPY